MNETYNINLNTVYKIEEVPMEEREGQIAGLQRQIVALKQCLKENGVVINDDFNHVYENYGEPQIDAGELACEKTATSQAEYEWHQDPNIWCLGCNQTLSTCVCETSDSIGKCQGDLPCPICDSYEGCVCLTLNV